MYLQHIFDFIWETFQDGLLVLLLLLLFTEFLLLLFSLLRVLSLVVASWCGAFFVLISIFFLLSPFFVCSLLGFNFLVLAFLFL